MRDQFSSTVVPCFTADFTLQSFDFEIWRQNDGVVHFFCQVAKVPNFSSTRDEKAAIKPVSVFSMCVLLTCLDESDREIQMREEVGAVKAQGCGVDTL